MTGFGRAATPAGDIVVELKSVNHRGLDVRLIAPAELEETLRGRIKARVSRGRIEGRVDLKADTVALAFDGAVLERLAAEVGRVAARIGVSGGPTFADLVALAPLAVRRDVPPPPSEAVAGSAQVAEVLDRALDALLSARQREGAALRAVIASRLDEVLRLVEAAEKRVQAAKGRLTTRLNARLHELVDAVAVDPARLAQEVALLVDKADVREEIDRLGIHLSRFQALLDEPAPGRTADFLCQELLREANTVGSKTQDAEVSQIVVLLKTEIERIREQIQNVE